MKTPEDSITATDIKNNFGDCLQKVLKKHKPLLIQKHGKPAAVLVEFEEWKGLDVNPFKEKKIPWIENLKAMHKKIKKNKIKSYSSVELIKKAREEGY